MRFYLALYIFYGKGLRWEDKVSEGWWKGPGKRDDWVDRGMVKWRSGIEDKSKWRRRGERTRESGGVR